MFETTTAAVNPLAVLKPTRQPRRYTLAEWLRLEARTEEKYEYYNGIIKKMAYAKGPHNEIAMNIGTAMKIAFKSLKKKYRVYSSDQKVYFPELNFGVFADVLVVCEKPTFWDDNQLLLTNPLLVVEVLSKRTEKYNREGKFTEYKTLPSFREYVLVKQDQCRVETQFREEPGLWRETIVTEPAGTIFLKSVGCSILLADIYENIEF